jgi:hypothetical protein
MRTLSVLALFAAGLVAAPVNADEKDAKKELSGSFKRKAGDLDMKIVFKKDNMMEFHIAVGDASAIMTSKYTKEKDGTIKCEVTDFEKKGDFPVSKDKGYKFSFKWETKDKKGVLSDLKGDDIADEQKQAVEGDYETASD